MLNGLDLFSGIGGISLALSEWVRPIAYCEIESYCQGVLLSRMANGDIGNAPIWDDLRTLQPKDLPSCIDIIYGGFPCQDISIAGLGKGLEGKRSGLFFEIVRLAKEIKPRFIFLENVPAITSRGGLRVVREIAEMGYDCRWCTISAASVGALHRRERWFLLAHAQDDGSARRLSNISGSNDEFAESQKHGQNKGAKPINASCPSNYVADSASWENSRGFDRKIFTGERTGQGLHSAIGNSGYDVADTTSESANGHASREKTEDSLPGNSGYDVSDSRCFNKRSAQESEWAYDQLTGRYRFWETEPAVGRVADGISDRVGKLRALGNSVVPQQVKEAFKILMGLK